MRIADVELGTTVKLNVAIDGNFFEFDTTIRLHHKKSVFLDPIRKGNKLLNLQGENVSVSIMLIKDEGKPLLWQQVEVECVRYKQQIFYSVSAELVGEEHNRRGDYRLFIGEEMPVKVGSEQRERMVVLKDISNSGFAFVSTEELKEPEGLFVYMAYVSRLNEEICELDLFGKIVRTMNLDDGRFLYGCVLVKKNELIGHYINQKQMEQMAKRNQSMVDKKAKKRGIKKK